MIDSFYRFTLNSHSRFATTELIDSILNFFLEIRVKISYKFIEFSLKVSILVTLELFTPELFIYSKNASFDIDIFFKSILTSWRVEFPSHFCLWNLMYVVITANIYQVFVLTQVVWLVLWLVLWLCLTYLKNIVRILNFRWTVLAHFFLVTIIVRFILLFSCLKKLLILVLC